jgi:hypothetical protein
MKIRAFSFAFSLCLILGVFAAAHTRPAAAQTSHIEYNETAQSSIPESANEERWDFTGYAGDLILIDMRADGSNLDCYLTLLDAFGTPLISDDDGGEGLNARIGPYRLPGDGTYTILAGRYSGAGSYLLELKNLNTIPMISPGKSLAGVLDSRHPTDYFLLPVSAADTLWRLSVSDDDASTDPYLALYGPSGLVISTEYDGGSSLDPVVTLPDRTYIAVVSWNPGSSGGPYQLDLNPSEVDLLNSGVPQTGTLNYDLTRHRHYFRGEAGQTVRLTASVDGDISLSLNVMSQDSVVTLFSNTGDALRTLTVTLDITQSGVYTVEVWDGSYGGSSGSYTLSFENVP